ncbi:MAG: hypothetical protein AAGH15_06915 [Myxococcota bacterium]
MASQRALEVLETRMAGPGRVHARLRLACGCEFEKEIAADRVQELEGGGRLAVGKYPCPNDHPVARV